MGENGPMEWYGSSDNHRKWTDKDFREYAEQNRNQELYGLYKTDNDLQTVWLSDLQDVKKDRYEKRKKQKQFLKSEIIAVCNKSCGELFLEDPSMNEVEKYLNEMDLLCKLKLTSEEASKKSSNILKVKLDFTRFFDSTRPSFLYDGLLKEIVEESGGLIKLLNVNSSWYNNLNVFKKRKEEEDRQQAKEDRDRESRRFSSIVTKYYNGIYNNRGLNSNDEVAKLQALFLNTLSNIISKRLIIKQNPRSYNPYDYIKNNGEMLTSNEHTAYNCYIRLRQTFFTNYTIYTESDRAEADQFLQSEITNYMKNKRY